MIADFGQNISGWVRITVTGAAGDTVTLRHAELLTPDGELETEPNRTAEATDRYTLRGGGEETWEPRFTFHGFRYVEVSGWPGDVEAAVAAGDIVARVYHSDLERTGWFTCSDPLVNRLHENVVWSMRGNFLDIPTDCPQRDERVGWTGDIQVFAPTAAFLYDVSGMLSSWLRDVAVDQLPDGTVPWYVPVIPAHEKWTPIRPGAAWGDVATLTPWDLYTSSGDAEILARQYDSAKAWVELGEAGRPGPVVGQRVPARRLVGPRSTTAGPGRRAHRPLPRGHRLLRAFGAAPGRDRHGPGPHRRSGPVRRAGGGGPNRLHRRIPVARRPDDQ